MPKTRNDIETIDDDDERLQGDKAWPRTMQAIARFGVSKRLLEQAVKDKRVKYVYDSSNERRFDPESLAELSGMILAEQSHDELAASIIKDLRKSNTDLVQSNQQLLRLATAPAFRAYRAVANENRSLRRHNRKLERKHMKMLEAFEAALTESHDREMKRVAAASHQARLDKGFDALMGQLPNIIAGLGSKKTLDKLFKSLQGPQIELLLELVTPDQKELLLALMKNRNSAPASQNGRSSSGGPTDDADKGAGPSGNDSEVS